MARAHFQYVISINKSAGQMSKASHQDEPGLELSDDKEYEVEAIRDSTVYAKKADRYLPELYYLVTWKGYPEEKNTWEPSLTVMHLRKMVNTFHKDHPEKPTATSTPLDSAPPMAGPTI